MPLLDAAVAFLDDVDGAGTGRPLKKSKEPLCSEVVVVVVVVAEE